MKSKIQRIACLVAVFSLAVSITACNDAPKTEICGDCSGVIVPQETEETLAETTTASPSDDDVDEGGVRYSDRDWVSLTPSPPLMGLPCSEPEYYFDGSISTISEMTPHTNGHQILSWLPIEVKTEMVATALGLYDTDDTDSTHHRFLSDDERPDWMSPEVVSNYFALLHTLEANTTGATSDIETLFSRIFSSVRFVVGQDDPSEIIAPDTLTMVFHVNCTPSFENEWRVWVDTENGIPGDGAWMLSPIETAGEERPAWLIVQADDASGEVVAWGLRCVENFNRLLISEE